MGRYSSKLEITLGILTVLTGLLYILQVFGQTESEVGTWGFVAVLLGGIVFIQGVVNIRVNKVVESLLLILVLIIQIPAILLWFIFHGNSISDGTPASNFVAHWIFATPHIVITLFALVLFTLIIRRKPV